MHGTTDRPHSYSSVADIRYQSPLLYYLPQWKIVQGGQTSSDCVASTKHIAIVYPNHCVATVPKSQVFVLLQHQVASPPNCGVTE